jgi:hypothetical protein
LLGLLFNPEDGGSVFLHNINEHLLDYTVSQPRRKLSSLIYQCKLNSSNVTFERVAFLLCIWEVPNTDVDTAYNFLLD